MATGTNHWKLGLFVLLGAAVAVSIVVWLGASHWKEDVVEYTSFFDESIQGLDIGSPVKFRGVDIGRVTAVGVAPDQRHVSVVYAVTVASLKQLHLSVSAESKPEETLFLVHPDMRAQLAQTGITGVKFVLIDYFKDPGAAPVALTFPLPKHYLPSVPSTLKQIENSLLDASEQIPEIARQLSETLQSVKHISAQVEQSKLPERVVATLDQTSLAMRQLNQQLAGVDAVGLSSELRHTLGSVNATLGHFDSAVEKVVADDGLLQRMQVSIDSIGEIARGAQSVGPEVGMTLKDVRGAARSIRRLADSLETDPDMLLKGRAVATP